MSPRILFRDGSLPSPDNVNSVSAVRPSKMPAGRVSAVICKSRVSRRVGPLNVFAGTLPM